MVLSGLSRVPDLGILEYCYVQQVRGFKPLSDDIARYNREEEGSKDRSYEFCMTQSTGTFSGQGSTRCGMRLAGD